MALPAKTTRADGGLEIAVCSHWGTATGDPGINNWPRDVDIRFQGPVTCTLQDGSTLTGWERARGFSADATCAFRIAYFESRIQWDDGTHTDISYTLEGVATVINETGSIASGGRWAGHLLIGEHVISGFNLLECLTEKGVTFAEYDGGFVIVDP